jgi:hypothetical protein
VLPILPLRTSLFCVFFSLILVSSLSGNTRLWTMAHVYTLPEQGVLLPKLWFSILLFLCRHHCWSCTHSHTTYSVCFHDGQYICFNPIYHPREQWLKVQCFTNSGKLINHTQVNDPNKSVSIYFDVCAAIAKNTGS